MKTILYVSRSRMREAESLLAVERMIEAARDRNQSEGVTGALIFTGARFAQLLEGPPSGVDRIMSSILLDPRHDQMKLVSVGSSTVRRFEGWEMAYSGVSAFVDRHIRPLFLDLPPLEQDEAGSALIEMMLAFATRRDSAA